MIRNYSKTFIVILMLVVAGAVTAGAVTFKFDPRSIKAGTLKTQMESNISKLLTAINTAGTTGSALNLTGVNIEPAAKTRFEAFWKDMHFTVNEPTIVTNCLNDYQGYQVRKIRITMKPQDPGYNESVDRELTISLNKSGVITGVRPAWQVQEDVSKMLESSGGVTDTRQRLEILKWVEDFRNYYNERNLNALKQVYSDDALIITGSVVKQRKNSGDGAVKIENMVKYVVQSKSEYMTKLQRIFRNNKYIDVKFDHISVVSSGSKKNIYGVTLHQTWKTSGYSDEGWLFLLWDFNDPEHPQIHVRTWQPDQVVAQHGKFDLDDFFIP